MQSSSAILSVARQYLVAEATLIRAWRLNGELTLGLTMADRERDCAKTERITVRIAKIHLRSVASDSQGWISCHDFTQSELRDGIRRRME